MSKSSSMNCFPIFFSPRLTVISCWLNSSACLAIEYSLQRKGKNWYWTDEPTFLLHILRTGEKRVNKSEQHNQACWRCVVYYHPPVGMQSSGVPAGWWSKYIRLYPNKAWAPVPKTHLKSQSTFFRRLYLFPRLLFQNALRHWTLRFLHQ